jgi:hypothetical protein
MTEENHTPPPGQTRKLCACNYAFKNRHNKPAKPKEVRPDLKPRPHRTVFLRIGSRWHWHIIGRYDDSRIASGSEPRLALARAAVKKKRAEILNREPHDQNHRSN